MEKWRSTLLLLCILLTHPLFTLHSKAQPDDFVRQPPRPVVVTTHHGSETDPQQVHISLSGEDHMKVSWITNAAVPSTVEYGKVSGEYTATATGTQTSYHYFSYKSGKIHHVKIGPLEPDTVYYYRCGGFGPEFSFKTPPATFPIEFVVVEHVDSIDYDVFLLPGDLSYANGQQPLWDSFGHLVEPYASRRPWMVTQGNHDIESHQSNNPKDFTAYNARWPMPYQESGSNSNLFYSFNTRVYDNEADSCSPVYITIGDGGNREGLAMTFEEPTPSISVYREPSFGHGRLRILNTTHAHWTWHRNDDSNPFVADQVWLESLSSTKACHSKIPHDEL
ncbi:Calcineurin-like phosphoesterase domain, ApaH type [Dillenia turbinata]|uniref:Calcineurin-like phosphoesterase domain, ApaH type n=1 Tax=Dillenia turbinata TaxID=194707 RepID=A0AAN8ZQZ8_9MAGN